MGVDLSGTGGTCPPHEKIRGGQGYQCPYVPPIIRAVFTSIIRQLILNQFNHFQMQLRNLVSIKRSLPVRTPNSLHGVGQDIKCPPPINTLVPPNQKTGSTPLTVIDIWIKLY